MHRSEQSGLVGRIKRRLRRRGLVRARIGEPAVDSVAISMVRNEQDIIEPFLRHTSRLVDLMFVIDNRSTDDTRAIMTSTARELGNIVVTDLPDLAYNQSQTMTRALRHVQSSVFADFVFFLDADEFISVEDKPALRKALARLPAGHIGLLPWRTHLPAADLSEQDHQDPLDRLPLRRKHEDPQYYKAVLRMAGGLEPGLVVAQGNHRVANARGKKLPSTLLEHVELIHLPLRSADQLLAKGVIGWEANRRRDDYTREPTAGHQWKRLHDMAERGERPSADQLMQEALAYAQVERIGPVEDHVVTAAHGISVPRRYSDGRAAATEELIAASRREASGGRGPMPLPEPPGQSVTETVVDTAFETDWHWDRPFLDEPPVRFALERLDPKSVLDVGCGIGLYAKLCQHIGVTDVLGVDGLPLEATSLGPEEYLMVDLQEPFDAGRRFDLVICLEVAEHLHPSAADTLLDTLARHAEGPILFSMAEPGQPGHGHIASRSISDVLELWAQRGWQPDLAMTLGLRSISSLSWLRRNVVLLQPAGRSDETSASRVLRQIGALPFEWYGQPPGQRAVAFAEPHPAPPKGYGRLKPAAERGR